MCFKAILTGIGNGDEHDEKGGDAPLVAAPNKKARSDDEFANKLEVAFSSLASLCKHHVTE